MTDTEKDKSVQENFEGVSFKDKILADLAAARRERQRQRDSWLKKESKTPDTVDDFLEEAAPTDQPVTETTKEASQIPKDFEVFKSELVQAMKVVEQLSQEKDQPLDFQVEEKKATRLEEEVPMKDDSTLQFEAEPSSEGVPSPQTILESKDSAPVSPAFSKEKEEKPLDLMRGLALSDRSSDSAEGGNHLLSPEDWSAWTTKGDDSFLEQEDSKADRKIAGEAKLRRQIRKKTNRLAAKISTVFVSLLLLLILGGGFFTYRYVTSAIGPLDSQATDYIQVEIPLGSGNKLIGQILEENGVIKDATVFNFYTKFKNYSNFQSGYYNFQKSMSLDDIAQYLQEGGTAEPQLPILGKILIPEGYTLKQISDAIALNSNTEDATDKTPFTREEFMATVQDETFIAEMVAKYPNLLASLPEASAVKYRLEGYLFPATYAYYEGTTIKDLIDHMLAAMDSHLAPYYTTIANNGMTVNQVLTMASLVEKEGATDDDREMIASVFYNRWNIGMPLQSNIAILYAMDKLGEKTTLAEDATIDTSIDSPYNIYLNTGLMPGPVDSPGLSALMATITPARTSYYYFVADVTTGTVYFAETYEEHSANVEKYVNSQLQ